MAAASRAPHLQHAGPLEGPRPCVCVRVPLVRCADCPASIRLRSGLDPAPIRPRSGPDPAPLRPRSGFASGNEHSTSVTTRLRRLLIRLRSSTLRSRMPCANARCVRDERYAVVVHAVCKRALTTAAAGACMDCRAVRRFGGQDLSSCTTHARTRPPARPHARTHACTHARTYARTHTHTHYRVVGRLDGQDLLIYPHTLSERKHARTHIYTTTPTPTPTHYRVVGRFDGQDLYNYLSTRAIYLSIYLSKQTRKCKNTLPRGRAV